QRKDGSRPGDFMLGDVFGATYRGETSEGFTYMAPEHGKERLFGGFTARHPLGLDQPQMRVALRPGAQSWATIVLPYTHPDDWERFASIHSNPPGIPTSDPAVV